MTEKPEGATHLQNEVPDEENIEPEFDAPLLYRANIPSCAIPCCAILQRLRGPERRKGAP